MFSRVLAWFAATSIGFGLAHVVVLYFFCKLVLGTIGIKAAAELDSALGAGQTLNVVVVAAVVALVFGDDVKNELRSATARLCLGIGVALLLASIAARALL